jgi:hypothetical protein
MGRRIPVLQCDTLSSEEKHSKKFQALNRQKETGKMASMNVPRGKILKKKPARGLRGIKG